ncbi:hypothetical protein CIHG_00539 [Coccidioides immitis H538.4]|uniref:Uncharacterized protein n=1 Tax=Coccidioides immitis H538.4 TaxID=396776 RepID=A0A0J8RCY9_COCIT|nr:hypothetical protein CIHG_00539 [Coccidioides immitis H538.4]
MASQATGGRLPHQLRVGPREPSDFIDNKSWRHCDHRIAPGAPLRVMNPDPTPDPSERDCSAQWEPAEQLNGPSATESRQPISGSDDSPSTRAIADRRRASPPYPTLVHPPYAPRHYSSGGSQQAPVSYSEYPRGHEVGPSRQGPPYSRYYANLPGFTGYRYSQYEDLYPDLSSTFRRIWRWLDSVEDGSPK